MLARGGTCRGDVSLDFGGLRSNSDCDGNRSEQHQ
jgi:hypothetical protein